MGTQGSKRLNIFYSLCTVYIMKRKEEGDKNWREMEGKERKLYRENKRGDGKLGGGGGG